MSAQDLFEALEAGMLERLRDKQPAVRAHASRVLARIAQPLEEVCVDHVEVQGILQLR